MHMWRVLWEVSWGRHWMGQSRTWVRLVGGVRIVTRMCHRFISWGGPDYDIMSDTILDM